MRASLFVLVTFTLFGSPISAQSSAVPGERVRVIFGDRQRAIGTFDSLSTDSVYLRIPAGSRPFAIARGDVRRFDRSLGRQRHFGRNFGITVGLSALVAAGVSAATWEPCRDPGFLGLGCLMTPSSRGDAFVWGLAGGAMLGVPLGLIIGVAQHSEAWEPLIAPAAHGPSLELAPVLGRRMGIAGTIRLGG